MKNEIIDSLIKLLERDLDRLAHEIISYRDEKAIWTVDGEIKNTAGNLCLHLCGNLQHYIGNIIGQSGYVRNRELEFSEKFRSRNELLNEIDGTKAAVGSALRRFEPKMLEANYPEEVLGYPMSYTYFLIHLYGHFNYHLGQINYHRRLLG